MIITRQIFFRKIACGIFAGVLLLPALPAHSEIIYATEMGRSAHRSATGQTTNETSYADERPFYLGAGYNYSMWEKITDRPLVFDAHNNSTFDLMAGVRFLDWLRAELNYYHAHFDLAGRRLYMTGETFLVNAIVDARLNHKYRFQKRQWFVPYVGLGAGVSRNTLHSDVVYRPVKMERNTPFTWTAMAGIAIEFNDSFALDFGYRYMRMSAPKLRLRVDFLEYELDDYAPTSHQFRAGFRVSFGL